MQDATALLDQISGALDAAATHLFNSIGDDRPLNEIWGWNMPAITREEFAAIIREPIELIRSLENRNVEDGDFNLLNQFPNRIAYFQGNVVPNTPGGNAFHGYIGAVSLVNALKAVLFRYAPTEPGWEKIEDSKLVPASQLRRLRQLRASIDKVTTDSTDLSAKIDEINAARSAAEALPADLQGLAEARTEYAAAMAQIEDTRAKLADALERASRDREGIEVLRNQAFQLVQNTEAAQAAATTQGLGAAFDRKARYLGYTTAALGVILGATLGLAAWISAALGDPFALVLIDDGEETDGQAVDVGVAPSARRGSAYCPGSRGSRGACRSLDRRRSSRRRPRHAGVLRPVALLG